MKKKDFDWTATVDYWEPIPMALRKANEERCKRLDDSTFDVKAYQDMVYNSELKRMEA